MPEGHQPLIDETLKLHSGSQTGFFTPAEGARMRYAVLDPDKDICGTIVIAPGRREFIEKKYIELGPAFLQRGFRLIFFEWRGQGLSSRALEGENRQRDHGSDFSLHLADLDAFTEKIVKPQRNGPLLLCGHSMGAHLLLRWLMEKPHVAIAGAILTAPMLALSGPLAHGAASVISWGAQKLGYGEDYAPMQHDYNAQDRAFESNPLTQDRDRFRIIENYFAAYPEMAVGGVTWDWLHGAIKSMHLVQKRSMLESVSTPLLTITGGKDHVTPANEIGHFLKLIPTAENFTVEGARHDIMNEIDSYRLMAWRHIDGFLRKTINPYKFMGL